MKGTLGAFHVLLALLPAASQAAHPGVNQSQYRLSTQDSGSAFAVGTRLDTTLSDYATHDGSTSVLNRFNAELILRESREKALSGGIDIDTMIVSTRERSIVYPMLRELYATLKNPKDLGALQVSFGFKKFPWSVMDSYWNLGIWEPRYNWDVFAPESRGLVGLYLGSRTGLFQFNLFGSFGFIPEKNSYFDEGQMDPRSPQYTGRCISHSPTFSCPAPSVDMGGVQFPVKYSLELPPFHKIWINPSVGLSARFGGETGFWGQVSYGYKPINQIILSYDPFATLDAEARVPIYPRIMYHELRAVEFGWRQPKVQWWTSLTGERPIRDATDPQRTAQDLNTALFASSGVSVSPLREERMLNLHGAILRIMGGDSFLVGPKAAQIGSSSEPRLLFTTALSLGARGELGRFGYSTYFLYDFLNEGNLLSTSVQWKADQNWSVLIGAEFLGVGAKAATRSREDFFTLHAAQDRVYGGVKYVF